MRSGLLRASLRLRPPYRLHQVYERLLGTEVELQVVADRREQAERAEAAALDELERLSTVLNRFDPHSELRRWLARPGERLWPSPELLDVLRQADRWRLLSGGAFHPGADALGALWQRAQEQGRLPEPERLAAQVGALADPPWTLHADGSVTLHASYPLGLNALAKGFIVDRMLEAARACGGVRAVLVNAGGDLRTSGGRGTEVLVSDPRTRHDNAPPLSRIRVRDAALATSGAAHRHWTVAGRRYAQVLDPRSGWPVEVLPGVSVIAPTCADADALATVLCVLRPDDGLALLDTLPGTAALLCPATGPPIPSRHWPYPVL